MGVGLLLAVVGRHRAEIVTPKELFLFFKGKESITRVNRVLILKPVRELINRVVVVVRHSREEFAEFVAFANNVRLRQQLINPRLH
jgi:virulence-associated protein VagC